MTHAPVPLCRCAWAGSDPLYCAYHDTEWGVPERDDRALWEKLVLDGFQARLSWITILRKREAFRAAFEGFDPEVIARWGQPEGKRPFPRRARAHTTRRNANRQRGGRSDQPGGAA